MTKLRSQIIEKVGTAIRRIQEGHAVVMLDDEGRENEGDVVFAAEFANAQNINFMIKEARGLVCLALAPTIVDSLELPLQKDPRKLGPNRQTAFTVSIEASTGITTGISASERAHTIRTAVSQDALPSDLVVPGHIFPLRAHPEGVLGRDGHTEGSVDLMKMAGLRPAAVICEVLNDDGTMARYDDLVRFCERHELFLITVAEILYVRRELGVLTGTQKGGSFEASIL